ncbi:MAG: Unknown protein [uncultured Thiotrichaceae bacterium]|uniref:Histidine kinase/HSP90-like ATPase domain-containing protein n=1 Tax=uncultured Thiotrichaceae bacterium TaxID=298394 RepID=A0A6S6TAB8_9GAMM|nr:MAG: Unknown protein [uncultured Thiotrichaceae bacterium]
MAEHLHAFCKENKIDESHTGLLELILVEAINNVIEHAYSNEAGNDIEVEFSIENQNVIMQVTDQGTPVPVHLRDGDLMPDSLELPEGGWGLGLINALADDVTFSSKNGSNTVTLSKQLAA